MGAAPHLAAAAAAAAALPPPHPTLLPPLSACQACSKYEYVKQYELDDRLLPGCWIVVRLDGKGFTKCARRSLPRPRGRAAFRAHMHASRLSRNTGNFQPTLAAGSATCTSLRSPMTSGLCGSWTKQPRWAARCDRPPAHLAQPLHAPIVLQVMQPMAARAHMPLPIPTPSMLQAVMQEYQDIRLAFGESDEYSFVFAKDCQLYGAVGW